MASKPSNRGGGPGTYSKGGVQCTMDAPWQNGANKGGGNGMNAPFNAPRAGGDNGLPTTVYDTSMGGPGKGPKASDTSSLGTIKTDPKGRRA
jgi:hypothetical protein